MEAITPVIQYVESHFERVQSNASSDAEMLNMLGGDGGSHVDVVFYIIRNSKPLADLSSWSLLICPSRIEACRYAVPEAARTADKRHSSPRPSRYVVFRESLPDQSSDQQ